MQWYQYAPTQYYGTNGERGIDLGTPNNTPLSIPLAGTVLKADYYGGGGEVIVKTANNLLEYFFHLNNIFVKAGQSIGAGSIVGTSGGGVGDKHLSPSGSVETVTNQQQLMPYSTNYHTEYGLIKGSTLQDYYNAMNTGAGSINPLDFINNLNKTGLKAVPIPNATSTGGSTSTAAATTGIDIQSQLSNWFAQQFTNSVQPMVSHFLAIAGFIIVGLVLAVFGMSLLTGSVAIPTSPSGGAVVANLHKVVSR